MKSIHAQTLIQAFERWVPKSLAYENDKIGCQIGTLNKKVKKVMVTLDVLENVVDEAIEKGIDLIVSHHAVIFRPLKNVRSDEGQGKIVSKCLKHDIAVYVAHTNLDIASGGMNDMLADELDLRHVRILKPTHTEPESQGANYGLGRIGDLEQSMTLEELAELVKQRFGLDGVRVTGKLDDSVRKVAVSGGDGNDLVPYAKYKGADVLITGDIYYHTAHDAILHGLKLIDAGHHIENIMKKGVSRFLTETISSAGYDTEVIVSEANTNPFTFV